MTETSCTVVILFKHVDIKNIVENLSSVCHRAPDVSDPGFLIIQICIRGRRTIFDLKRKGAFRHFHGFSFSWQEMESLCCSC